MKIKYAKKFSRFLLATAVANAAALGAAPAALQSQQGPTVTCFPVEEDEWASACRLCKWLPGSIFCDWCFVNALL